MHMNFHFPEVTDAYFLSVFKKVMIEVAGNRLYDYRAAEQVEEALIAGGHSCPCMEKEAAAEGFTRYSKIKDFIRLQMDIVQSAAEKPLDYNPSFEMKSLLDRELLESYKSYQKANPDYRP